MPFKFCNAIQAQMLNSCFNIKTKLYNTIANIKFNKKCLAYKVIPKYATFHINVNNFASKKTKEQTQILWINNEIKFLYRKKEYLNRKLYQAHLAASQYFGPIWDLIQHHLSEKLETIMTKKV